MTEDEARQWVTDNFGARATERVASFVEAVIAESANQNLIARSTLEKIWERHVVDSAQLLTLAGDRHGQWVDIGSGAGFPGMVIAILSNAPTLLVEPRRRRANFLADCANRLGMGHDVTVAVTRAETVKAEIAATVSARAVASVTEIFAMSRHFVNDATCYVLPRGRSVAVELEDAKVRWQGMFHVEPSMTDPASGIFVASKVRPR